jgi:hypothetical protein
MEGNIYCLRNAELFYIGSTKKDLKERLFQHKYDAKRNHTVSSKQIIEQGNYDIYLIEKCDLDNLKKREGEIIKEFKKLYGTMCINQIISGRDWRQYRLDNPKHKKERTTQTKEQIAEKRSVLIECDCGIPYQLKHKSRHSKSQRHLNNLQK